MAEHYFSDLGETIELFRAQVRSTGQTIPFDEGRSAATLYMSENKLYVGVNSKDSQQGLIFRNSRGSIELNVSDGPEIEHREILGRWYQIELTPTELEDDSSLCLRVA